MEKSTAVQQIRAFNRFYTNILGVLNRHFLDSPYSLTEVRIMFEIFHDPETTVRKIKNLLMVDEGYLSRTITRLVKQGLVSKTQSTRDRRRYELSLTPKGNAAFLELNARQQQAVEAMVGQLSSEELDELTSMMARIRDLLAGGDDNQ